MKKSVSHEETHSTPQKKDKKYFIIPIPKFSLKETGANGLLVLSLVIFSFLLGMLTNKVIYLESQLNAPVPTPAVDQAAAAPTPPLVVKDMQPGKLPILGNKNAKVTIVEFSDFQCPFCKQYFDTINKDVDKEYIKTGKVKFAYRHYPLVTIHPNAQKAAEASECANEQNKFWEYHDLLFQTQNDWANKSADDAKTNFIDLAGQAGMDASQFQSCFESEKYKGRVDTDSQAATKAQVDATPTFFINGTRVLGAVPFPQLKTIIDAALKE